MGLRYMVEKIRSGQLLSAEIVIPPYLQVSMAEASLSAIVHSLGGSLGRPHHWSDLDPSTIWTRVENFHSLAGTRTPEIVAMLRLLEYPRTPIFRFAHTPDFLPYSGVALQAVLLDAMRSSFEIANPGHAAASIMLMTDVDTASDSRVRSAVVPDFFRPDGLLRLGVPVPRQSRTWPTARLPAPAPNHVRRLKTLLSQHVDLHVKAVDGARHRALRDRFRSNIEPIIEDLRYAQEVTTSLSKFNSVVFSRIVTLRLGIPLLMVFQVENSHNFYPAYRTLVSGWSSLRSASSKAIDLMRSLGEAPTTVISSPEAAFWLICPRCGARSTPATLERVVCFRGSCVACRQPLAASLDRPPAGNAEVPTIVPKVLIDSLLDATAWNVAAGVSYLGSTNHVVYTLSLLRELRHRGGVDVLWSSFGRAGGVPEYLWGRLEEFDPTDRRRISAERNSLSRLAMGRDSIVYRLIYKDSLDLSRGWREHLLSRGLNVPHHVWPSFDD